MVTSLVLVIVLLLCQSLLSKPVNRHLNEVSMESSTLSTFFELPTSHHHRLVFCGNSSNHQTEISQVINKTTNLKVKLNYMVKCLANVGNLTELGSIVKFKSELIAVTKDREPSEYENPCPETSNEHYYLNHLFNSNVSYEKNHFSHSLLQYDRFGRLSHYCIRITPFIPDKSCPKCASYSSYQKFSIINDPLKRPPNPVTCENLTLNYDLREEMTFANGVSSPSGSITFRFGKFINFESCKYPSLNFLITNSLNGDQLTYSIEPHVVEVIKMNFVLKTGPTINSTLTDCQNDSNSNIVDSKMIKIWHDYDDDEKFSHRERRKSVEFSNLKPGVKYCLIISVLKPNNFGSYFKGKNFHLDKIIVIPENIMADPPSTILPVTIEDKVWINVLIVIVFVFFLVSVLLFLNHLVKKDPDPIQTGGDSHTETNPTPPVEKNWKVNILYTHETDEIEKPTEFLYEFLKVACHDKILFDKHDLVKVSMDPLRYYTEADLSIIIETEGALLRETKYLDGERVHHINEDALDDFYIYRLIREIDRNAVTTNFSKYMVVRFSFSNLNAEFREKRFRLIPNNKRYEISEDLKQDSCNQLAKLCHFINYGKELPHSNENLERFREEWENTTQFQNLSSAIKDATEYVKKNPNYVKNIFKRSSESLSDTENDPLLSSNCNETSQTHL